MDKKLEYIDKLVKTKISDMHVSSPQSDDHTFDNVMSRYNTSAAQQSASGWSNAWFKIVSTWRYWSAAMASVVVVVSVWWLIDNNKDISAAQQPTNEPASNYAMPVLPEVDENLTNEPTIEDLPIVDNAAQNQPTVKATTVIKDTIKVKKIIRDTIRKTRNQ